MRRIRYCTVPLAIALVGGAACSEPADLATPPASQALRHDPDVGELVVPSVATAKVDAATKSKWTEMAGAAIETAKGKLEDAKAKAKDRLADMADAAGDMADVGDEMRKLVELTDEEYVALGRRCAHELDTRHKAVPLPDPRAARLSAIVSPHAAEDGVRLSVKLYESPVVNAFALPDGSVRVFTGLLDIATDEELRGVLGHELAHVVHKHSKNATRVAILASAGAKVALKAASGDVGKPGVIEALAVAIAEKLVNARYSRANERQADDYAFAFMMSYGYEPHGLVTLFEKFGNERQVSPFASHPPSAQRADRMRELIAKAHAK